MAHKVTAIQTTSPEKTIDTVTKEALDILADLDANTTKYVELSLSLGEKICFAKDFLPHGEFTRWCKTTFNRGASWCSAYVRLYKARDNLHAARRWAKQIGHRHRDTTSVDRLLDIIEEWRASIGQDSCRKSTKPSADWLRNFILNDPALKSLRDDLPKEIASHAEKLVAAIYKNQCPPSAVLLERVRDYLIALVTLGAGQTCGSPQLLLPGTEEAICNTRRH